MDSVFRGLAVYGFLLLLFRAFGKRSLAQITTFDFVMLLIIAETTQQALLGDDFSVTNSFLLIATLFVCDRGLSWLKDRSSWFERVTESVPLVILRDGHPLKDRMQKSNVDVSDILAAARELQGLERLEQIKYAVLEKGGGITIIPKRG
ncbi:MAG TPA: YetF domain-containing protein [Candidatus Synoicihabitans sp.]|nr:YetF domain-containing protein [Candidatus Synoicihabitans sp.]